MLSLPEDWDYTLKGLSLINREQIDAIRAAIRELEQTGYIVRSRERDSQGRLHGADYVIYEQPQPLPDSRTLEIQCWIILRRKSLRWEYQRNLIKIYQVKTNQLLMYQLPIPFLSFPDPLLWRTRRHSRRNGKERKRNHRAP